MILSHAMCINIQVGEAVEAHCVPVDDGGQLLTDTAVADLQDNGNNSNTDKHTVINWLRETNGQVWKKK